MSIVSFRQVRKNYGKIEALRGIDLDVRTGSVLVLLGPNGAGKSTLFGCLLGTVIPDAGVVRFQDKPVDPGAREQVGYLAERVALYPHRTVWENAEFIVRLKGIDPSSIHESLRRVELVDLMHRKSCELSKGQLQRAGLAIALAGAPDLLVLDEPFNGLDPVILDLFLGTIREEQERGATILISTHTISAGENIATDVALLLDGRLAEFSSLESIRERFPGESLEEFYHRAARRRLKYLEGTSV